jgi:hypothetical protein
VIAYALLGAMLVLWLLDVRHDLWEKLVVLAFLAAAAGVGASAVALREQRFRARARRGLMLSLGAVVLALAIEPVLSWIR